MTHDQLAIVGIGAAWAGAVGLLGLLLAYAVRRRSFRWQIPVVGVTAVLAVVAGVVGTARAMFLSDHDLSVVLWVVVVAGLVALIESAIVGTAFTGWSRSLREDARRFGDSGHFESGSRGPAELQHIADELGLTAARLQESRAREQRLEESRRELVSWVSHDLRSPLAALRAMTEALEDGIADDPSRYHRQIRAEVDRMVRMVDDLFELSRIHAGVLALNLQPVALGDVVSEALAGADAVARAGGVRLGGRVDDGLFVNADPAELSRVVSNLLMNAIRHTPADGVVEVTGQAVGGGIELSVTDGCGGISHEDMARVFDVAWQGSAARTPVPTDPRSPSLGRGAGLGLAIVKGIVEAHRGQVAVANHDPGCRFVVTLPA
ncbi:MAG: HAMP domain-containing sensor histidine kinase [Nocardioides sp.]